MRMLAIGDNVADCYLDEGLYYPGGNAVNVAVGCKRSGFAEVAYIGVFGDDPEARHIQWALTREGITCERSRHIHAASGHPGVRLVDGDRVFVGGPKDTAQHIVRLRLMPADLEYIAGFDICHTSCYSSVEPELPNIRQSVEVSFDFSSDYQRPEYLAQVCPHVRFAFFSGSHLPEAELDALLRTVHGYGTEVVGVTLGSAGALFSRKGQRFRQGIKPVAVVDTMGAGDSFIAGFLTRYTHGAGMEEALDFAATCAANTCREHGGFGYGKPLKQT